MAILALLNLVLFAVRHFRQPLPALPVRLLGYHCRENCGGLADRQKGIVTAFLMSAMLGVAFRVHVTQPCELGFLLSPGGAVDWRLKPGELTGRDVQWIDRLDSAAVDFAQVCSCARAHARVCVCVCVCVMRWRRRMAVVVG